MQNKTVTLYVDDIPVEIPVSSTVLQACEKLGKIIPRFCYHELLQIAGNCRICMVEIEKSPKPQVSCGLPVIHNMKVYTNTPLVRKAREAVLEFLLLNHPLDCPICDQGGECDLQNQSMKYGTLRSRYINNKRGVEDKKLGPVVKTVITRCIHCTRCIRFAKDVAGVEDLGTTARGSQTEVGTYLNKIFQSEVSANVIDLCPVGALTSKVYGFQARPWEITSIKSIDISDSLGSHTNIELKDLNILRVTPRRNLEINQEWLSDKARFLYEGESNSVARLKTSYFKSKYNFFKKIIKKSRLKSLIYRSFLKSYNFELSLGKYLDINTLYLLKLVGRRNGFDVKAENANNLLTNFPILSSTSLSLVDIKKLDLCLLLGINPRKEATIANLLLYNSIQNQRLSVCNFGFNLDVNYKYTGLGLDYKHLLSLIYGKKSFSLSKKKKPAVIYGDSISSRNDAPSSLRLILTSINKTRIKDWIGSYRFSSGPNSTGKSFLNVSKPNFLQFCEKKSYSFYNLGGQDLKRSKNPYTSFLESTHLADYKELSNYNYLIPLQSYLEKNGGFINCEGKIQENRKVHSFGIKPGFYLENYSFVLKSQTKIALNLTTKIFNFKECASSICQNSGLKFLKVKRGPLKEKIGDIYSTDFYSKSSSTLSKISGYQRKLHKASN